MTVAELIAALQQQAPNKPVKVRIDGTFDPGAVWVQSDADVVTNEGGYVLIDSK